VFTAASFGPDGTGLHGIGAIEDGLATIGLSLLQHFDRSWVNAFLF
jgi:hypothetical protein